MKFLNKLLLINIASTFNINKSLNKNFKTKMYYKPSKVIEEVSKTTKFMGKEWTLSDLLSNLAKHNIEAASIVDKQDAIIVIDKQHEANILGENIHLIKTIPPTANLIIDNFIKNHINFDVFVIPENPLSNIPFVVQFVLGYLVLSFIINFIRSQQMGGMNMPNNPMNMMFKKPELTDISTVDVDFSDVAGCEEAKNELVEVVDFLKNPECYADAGAKIPRGILLEGEPGTGKTLLARAVAGEAGVNFISASGSEFIEMFVGVGASRVRKLFEKARKNAPCVVFIDEIDAVGRQRGAGIGGGNDEREQTLNQLLTEMDGFEGNSGIIIIAATNRPDVLDSALMRPGRFDRQVTVDAPDISGRLSILKVHSRNKKLEKDLTLESIARRTPGFTGADLANLLNEAAILTARRRKDQIGLSEIDDAVDRIIAGMEGTPLVDGRSKRLIAYHEVGHALIGTLVKDHDPVQKVTVIPRGQAQGLTWFSPDDDQALTSKAQLKARIMGALGGRAAEDIIFGREEVTTGAGGDVQMVASMARQMVTRFGMSSLGPVSLEGDSQEVFVGRSLMNTSDISDGISKQIDEQVRSIVKKCYHETLELVEKNRSAMDKLVEILIEKETMDGDEFCKILSEYATIPDKDRFIPVLPDTK